MTSSAAISSRVRQLEGTAELTHQNVAAIVGTTARTVSRWGTGQSIPQREARQRLLELAYVVEELAKVIEPGERNLWLFSPNRLLNHDTPTERISSGDYRSVIALIEALADGIVT